MINLRRMQVFETKFVGALRAKLEFVGKEIKKEI